MNFKTTIVLVALLAVAGLAMLLTREKSGEKAGETTAKQQKLLDVQVNDVNKIVVTSSDGKKTALEKTGANWRLTEPVNAPAQAFEVDSLVRAVAELESTNTSSADAASTGLDKPRYTIDLTTSAGKTYTVSVGAKTAVGDSLYVMVGGDKQAHVVSADVLQNISKSASTYRDPKLVDLPEKDVNRITIKKPDGTLVLARGSGDNWRVDGPTTMPAEKSDVDDVLSVLTNLKAAEFVSEDTKDASLYQLNDPRFTATLSAGPTTLPVGVAAATAPAPTSKPTEVTIKFGRYDDVMKKNVLVTTSQTPVIAKVAATVIDTINKKPLDMRDKKVLDIDAAQVSSVTITSDIAATTKPTTKPASKKDVIIKRRHEVAKAQATTVASTKPATTTTAPATTQAATQPATKWEVAAGAETKPADDSRVDSLLSQLHPLRATKYLESAPTTQPSATYVVQITTQAAGGAPPKTDQLRLVDPGNSRPVVGTYNGLAFEVDRFLLERLSGDFLKGSKPAFDPNEAPPDTSGPPFGAP